MTISSGKARDTVPAVRWALHSPSLQLAFTAAFGLLLLAVSAQAQVAFEDVSEEAGLTGFTESWGITIGDINNDNCQDIVFNGHRDYPRIYRNTCTGTFEDITYELDDGTWIEKPSDDKHGAAFGDFDNDGDQDLFFSVSITGDGQLWVNQGDGSFVESARSLNVRSDFAARVAGFADFNHDGKLDTFQMGLSPGSYLRYQNSSGTFSTLSGTDHECNDEDIKWAHFLDINNDDRLEMVCAMRGIWPYRAYDFTSIPFVDVSDQLPSRGNANAAIVGDFDRNLRNDVLVLRGAIHPSGARLVNNRRIEAWIEADPGDPANVGYNFQSAGPITVTVWNRSLSRNQAPFVLNLPLGSGEQCTANDDWRVCARYNNSQNRWEVYTPEESQSYSIVEAQQNITNLNEVGMTSRDLPIVPQMFLNTAGGFVQTSGQALNLPVTCQGGTTGDFDNDMDVDIYLTCGSGPENLANRMYINQGNGTFVNQASTGAEGPTGVGFETGVAENAVVMDYDLDGFLDLAVSNGALYYPWGLGGPDILLHNLGNSNHWMQIKLQGVASNRDGMGAKVYVTANGVTQLREQNGGYTRWSQNMQWLHFGLAANTTGNVRIVWPSGHVDNHTNVAADRLYTAIEGGSMVPQSKGSAVFTALVPGDECGEPPYNLDYGPATFLWRDCGTDTWHFRAKGGRVNQSVLRSQGTIVADAPFSGVSGVSLDGGDSVSTAPASQVNFNIGVWFTNDQGFDFSTTGQASSCFDFSRQDIPEFIVGASGKRINTPIDLVTLFACGEEPPAGLSISDAAANENSGSLQFTVSLAHTLPGPVEFTVSTVDGTATLADGDYTQLLLAPYTIPAGSLSRNVIVPIGSDTVAEPDETFSVVLVGVSANARFEDDTGVGTIRNDDGPLPRLSIADVSAFEDVGELSFVVSLDIAAGADVSFQASTQGITASFFEGDYAGFTGQPQLIPAGMTTTVVNVPVGIDADVEDDETLNLILSNFSTNVEVVDGTAIGTILNDDSDGGVPNLTILDASAEEDSGLLTFTVALSGPAVGNVTFQASTANGSATVANGDYTALSGQAGSILAGSTSTTVTVALGVDGNVEPNETFTVSLANVSANVNVIDGTATGTILNDDVLSVPTLSIGDASVDEDAGVLVFTVSLSQAAGAAVTFNVSTANGTATVADGDYTALAGQAGSIPGGSLSTTVSVDIGVDSDVEADETFTVSLAGVSGNATLGDGTATGTILNDDADTGGPVPVTAWSPSQRGVSTSGNVITYSGSPTGWYLSTVNSQPLSDLGFVDDFELRFTVETNPANTIWIVGLGVEETGWQWQDVDYGLRSGNGQLTIYESGTWRTSSATMSAGDVISIYVNSGTIEYRLNGGTVYTSSYAGSPDFYVDTAFNQGAQTLSVEVEGTPVIVDPPDEMAITAWPTVASGVSVVNGSSLTFSGSPTNWTNTASSARLSTLGATDNYSVSWTVATNPTNTTWTVGLGIDETAGVDSWRDVDFGMRSSAGALNIRESGIWITQGPALAQGDVMSMHVNGTQIEYRLNGATIATSTTTGDEDFYVDTGFLSGAITLGDFTLSQ